MQGKWPQDAGAKDREAKAKKLSTMNACYSASLLCVSVCLWRINNFGGKGSTEFLGICCLLFVVCCDSALPTSWLQVDVCFLGLQRSSR